MTAIREKSKKVPTTSSSIMRHSIKVSSYHLLQTVPLHPERKATDYRWEGGSVRWTKITPSRPNFHFFATPVSPQNKKGNRYFMFCFSGNYLGFLVHHCDLLWADSKITLDCTPLRTDRTHALLRQSNKVNGWLARETKLVLSKNIVCCLWKNPTTE